MAGSAPPGAAAAWGARRRSYSGPSARRTTARSPTRPEESPIVMPTPPSPELSAKEREALAGLTGFPLLAAIFGRRSRRFPLGGEIPDGPLAYRSRHDHLPLSELETLLILATMIGT